MSDVITTLNAKAKLDPRDFDSGLERMAKKLDQFNKDIGRRGKQLVGGQGLSGMVSLPGAGPAAAIAAGIGAGVMTINKLDAAASTTIRGIGAAFDAMLSDSIVEHGTEAARKLASGFAAEVPLVGDTLAATIDVGFGAAKSWINFIKRGMDEVRDIGGRAFKLGLEPTTMLAFERVAGDGADALGRALFHLSDNLGRVNQGSMEALHNFQRAGLEGSKLAAMNLDDALLSISDHIKQIPSYYERARVASELFGTKAGKEMLPFLQRGRQGVDQARNYLTEKGLGFSSGDYEQMKKAQLALSEFQGTVTGLGRQIAVYLAPYAMEFSKVLRTWLPGFGNVKDAAAKFGEVTLDVMSSLLHAAPAVTDALSSIAATFVDIGTYGKSAYHVLTGFAGISGLGLLTGGDYGDIKGFEKSFDTERIGHKLRYDIVSAFDAGGKKLNELADKFDQMRERIRRRPIEIEVKLKEPIWDPKGMTASLRESMKDDFGVFTERMRAAQEAMDPDSPKRRERLDWLNKQLDSFNDLMGQKGSKRKELEDVQADNDKQRVEFRNKQKELMNQAAKDWADLPDDERQRKILDFQHQQAQERGGFERWARGREGNLAGEIDDLGERMEATPWVKQQLAQERGDVLRKKDLIDSREGKAMIGMAFDDLSRAFPGGEKRMSNAMFAGSSEAVSQMNRWKIGGQDVQTRMLMIQEAQKAAMDRLVKIGEQIMQQQAAQEAGAAIVKVVGVGAGGQ